MSRSKIAAILGALSLAAALLASPASGVLQAISRTVEQIPICKDAHEVGCFEDE